MPPCWWNTLNGASEQTKMKNTECSVPSAFVFLPIHHDFPIWRIWYLCSRVVILKLQIHYFFFVSYIEINHNPIVFNAEYFSVRLGIFRDFIILPVVTCHCVCVFLFRVCLRWRPLTTGRLVSINICTACTYRPDIVYVSVSNGYVSNS